MLILGTMEWASTIDRGEFVCPNCESVKSFQRKVSRPFLTLYFVPIIPIGGLRQYVICRSCRNRFDDSVLLEQGAIFAARLAVSDLQTLTFEEELLRIMALTIVEDQHVSAAEIEMAQRVYQGMFMRALSRPELDKACREVIALRINAARYLTRAGQGMTYDQKLMVVQAMFAVSGADGQISPQRMQSLLESKQRLELDDTAFQTAVKNASAWIT